MLRMIQGALLIKEWIVLSSIAAVAHSTDTAHSVDSGSAKKAGFVIRIHEFARTPAMERAAVVDAGKAAIAQNSVFDALETTIQKATIYLKNGIDTAGTRADHAMIERNYDVAKRGVLTADGAPPTFRNLTVTSKILDGLLTIAEARKARLITDCRHFRIAEFRNHIRRYCGITEPIGLAVSKETTIKYD